MIDSLAAPKASTPEVQRHMQKVPNKSFSAVRTWFMILVAGYLLGASTRNIFQLRFPQADVDHVGSTSCEESQVGQEDVWKDPHCGFPEWIWNLLQHELKKFSQFGEDGVTEEIFRHIQPTSKYYVEFGVQDGRECNTHFLREKGWTGLMMDGSHENSQINLHKEFIVPSNVVSLFQKYNVPKEFDFMSEDTHYADYYLWKELLEAGYRPRVVVSEINSNFLRTEAATVHAPPSDKPRFWDGTNYFGVSALALRYLWNKHGYTMVYCTWNQINCFGIRNDLLLGFSQNKSIVQAQECLCQNKPIFWRRQLHRQDKKNETYAMVNEEGDIISNDYVPSFNRG